MCEIKPIRPNMNFEDIPQPDITKQMLNNLSDVATLQDEYGLAKYGKALDHTFSYDWLEMALEEAADGLKYIQCEVNRKKDVIELLKIGIEQESFFPITQALKLLTIKGTGK